MTTNVTRRIARPLCTNLSSTCRKFKKKHIREKLEQTANQTRRGMVYGTCSTRCLEEEQVGLNSAIRTRLVSDAVPSLHKLTIRTQAWLSVPLILLSDSPFKRLLCIISIRYFVYYTKFAFKIEELMNVCVSPSTRHRIELTSKLRAKFISGEIGKSEHRFQW